MAITNAYEIKKLPTKYEAYVYEYRRLDTQKRYVGSRKGKVTDNYNHSSKDSKFKEDLANPNIDWEKYILHCGTYEEIKQKEYEILTKNDAAKNPLYYNAWNSLPSKKISSQPRKEEVEKLLKRINDGDFTKGKMMRVDVLINMERIQVRLSDVDQKPLASIFKKKHGVIDDNVEPVTILEHYGENSQDFILDGNTTLGAADESGVVKKLPVRIIPREDYEQLSSGEIILVGSGLNKREDKIQHNQTQEDLEHQITILVDGDEGYCNSDTFRDLVMGITNLAPSVVDSAIKKVAKNIKDGKAKAMSSGIRDWGAAKWKPELDKRIRLAEADGNTIVQVLPAGNFNFHKALNGYFKVVRPVGTDFKDSKDNILPIKKKLVIFVKFGYKDRTTFEWWDNSKDGRERQTYMLDMLSHALGFEYELVELEHQENKVKKYVSLNVKKAS